MCPMQITAQQIAEAAGVTPAYGRMLLAGTRTPSLAVAIQIFDATGQRLGPLEGLTVREIAAARKMAKAA